MTNYNFCHTCSTSLTSKGLRHFSMGGLIVRALAAPPWLQRDWDVCHCPPDSSSDLQHLPDFKGIETIWKLYQLPFDGLQHLPDFKGIETTTVMPFSAISTCSTSLTSKGLRRVFVLLDANPPVLAAPPWLQRDWDNTRVYQTHPRRPCSTSLTSKGLRLLAAVSITSRMPCSTSLTSKGLRPLRFKELIWFSACSTSLTSKGLRPTSITGDIDEELAAPPWLQRDWDNRVSDEIFLV